MFETTSKYIAAAYARVESHVRADFTNVLCLGVLIVGILITFQFESRVVGWEPGYDNLQPKHHGWVSAHTLAIISRATLENGFVGYALATRDAQNVLRYEYFDRYPVFFSALFNRVLSLVVSLTGKIYLAKQVMNAIFLATLIAAFMILDKLTGNRPLALAVSLLAFANPFLLFYKDMVHFDQPALLGFLLLIYTVALYKLEGRKRPLYAATFVAIGLGRGYASYAVFVVWLAIEAFLILRAHGIAVREKLIAILRHPSFHLFVIGIVWGASLLGYNVLVEARKTGLPILQTSIVTSADKRLSLNEEFNEDNVNIINWPGFGESQVNRIVQWSFPLSRSGVPFWASAMILAIMFICIGLLVRGQPLEKRIVTLVLALSGFAWMIPLRNLAAFHDYTTMYYIGVPLVFYTALFAITRPSKEAAYYLVVMALVIYGGAILKDRDLHETRAGRADEYTYDFQRINREIDGAGKNVFLADAIPYGPYPAGFYLSGQVLAPYEFADYVVTRDKHFGPVNLTPDNAIVYLFKK